MDGVDEDEVEDDFEAHRAAVTKFLNKVRKGNRIWPSKINLKCITYLWEVALLTGKLMMVDDLDQHSRKNNKIARLQD